MKKEYLQPFLRASEYISEQYFGVPVKNSNISVDKTVALDSEVLIIIGLRGDLNGIVVFGLEKDEAIALSKHVLDAQEMGYLGGEWNEISKSVLLEYGNQVAGFVSNLYGQKGLRCDITTPSFIKQEQISSIKKESIRFEMDNSIAKINVKLHIQGK